MSFGNWSFSERYNKTQFFPAIDNISTALGYTTAKIRGVKGLQNIEDEKKYRLEFNLRRSIKRGRRMITWD
jgi:hypothetical protein